MPARKPTPDEKPQFERFLEAVRENEVDTTDEALERVIRKIGPPKRPVPPKASVR